MHIAFNINRLGLIGLGVTLNSLIRNCSQPDKLTFTFLCSDLILPDKKAIEKLLKNNGLSVTAYFIDFNPMGHFGNLKAFFGDFTAYGRLLLGDYIFEDYILYLDADLVVELDVNQLDGFQFQGKVLAAVEGCKVRDALGSNHYIGAWGLSPNTPYFNSGVILFNLVEWRKREAKTACMEIANKHPMKLLSYDQSILNVYLAGNFARLPKSFNCAWYPHTHRPEVADRMIIHYVGSPKPWDLFGYFIHNGYETWRKYLPKGWYSQIGSYSIPELKRTWAIRRSYIRALKTRLKS